MTLLHVALSLAEEHGLPVFPCHPKTIEVDGKIKVKAKSPYTEHGFEDATKNVEQIAQWWERWPDALIGVPMGKASGLCAIDVDPRGLEWYREHATELAAGRVHTTQRGYHLLYRHRPGFGNTANRLADGLDTRGDDEGYIIWWPATGLEATGELEDVGELPEWAVAKVSEKPNGHDKAPPSDGGISRPDRSADLLARVGRDVRAGLADYEILGRHLGHPHARDQADPERAVRRCIEEARRTPNPSPASHSASHASSTTTSMGDPRPYILQPIDELLEAGPPVKYLVEGLIEEGVSVGFVGAPETAKSLAAQNIAACRATGRDFHGRKVERGLVVYLVGEGQPGVRGRFQALELARGMPLPGAPLVVSRVAASLLDPVEVERVRLAIRLAVVRHGPLSLLIVDTLSRFIAPGDESKAMDLGGYFRAVDDLRGEATGISLHHPGHIDGSRARGSSNWRASLDAEFLFTNDSGVITVTCQKMKDGEKPAPFAFRVEPAPTRRVRADGSGIQSVVLASIDALPPKLAGPTGKNQKRLLAELERIQKPSAVWTEGELRDIARALGMHRNSARDAVLGLRQLGYLTQTIGGSSLSFNAEGKCTK